MEKVTAEMYQQDPERYTLMEGSTEGAPTCTFGNKQKWVGYDKDQGTFIRFTKSVYKKLISQIAPISKNHGTIVPSNPT